MGRQDNERDGADRRGRGAVAVIAHRLGGVEGGVSSFVSFPPSYFAFSSSRSLLPKKYILVNAPTRRKNFLPIIDGSTITLPHLLQHLAAARVHAMLLSLDNSMHEYAGARWFGTFGVVFPGLKIK
jgi:hypothetical protein